MQIRLSLTIDGEETTIERHNFKGSYTEILKLVERACVTHNYVLPEFIGAYIQTIQNVEKQGKEAEEKMLQKMVMVAPKDDTVN